MISFIICSRHLQLLEQLEENIQRTINYEYEILPIDNSHNTYSIFEAYNIGVQKAKGDILCFCHEDILFHTEGWGQRIEDIFSSNPDIGVIGVAGSHFMPRVPMYWWSSPFISQYNIVNDNGVVKENFTQNYFHGTIAEVVVIDGLCMFMNAELFKYIWFDNTFSGFHAYDMDICMQVQKLGWKICVTNTILVEHFWSEKAFLDPQYMGKLNENMELFYNKWKEYLPMAKGIDEPQIVLERINNLCLLADSGRRTRKSIAYRLGRALLFPIKFILQ